LKDYSERDYQVDVQGHDPTWESNSHTTSPELSTPVEHASETQTAKDQPTPLASPIQSRLDTTSTNSIDISALANEVRNFELPQILHHSQ
jgi:hypothetical protein